MLLGTLWVFRIPLAGVFLCLRPLSRIRRTTGSLPVRVIRPCVVQDCGQRLDPFPLAEHHSSLLNPRPNVASSWPLVVLAVPCSPYLVHLIGPPDQGEAEKLSRWSSPEAPSLSLSPTLIVGSYGLTAGFTNTVNAQFWMFAPVYP